MRELAEKYLNKDFVEEFLLTYIVEQIHLMDFVIHHSSNKKMWDDLKILQKIKDLNLDLLEEEYQKKWGHLGYPDLPDED